MTLDLLPEGFFIEVTPEKSTRATVQWKPENQPSFDPNGHDLRRGRSVVSGCSSNTVTRLLLRLLVDRSLAVLGRSPRIRSTSVRSAQQVRIGCKAVIFQFECGF